MGGILVGYGTVISNGCTSGHAVCGISALRPRSMVATGTFCLTAFVTAMATNTSSFLPLFRNNLPVQATGITTLSCLAACVACTLVARTLQRFEIDVNSQVAKCCRAAFELVFGISFALAMAVSNMTKISAVIAFLDLRYWNPALCFVMGGAIFVAFVAFRFIFKFPRPFMGSKFDRPTTNEIDRKLVFGAVVFGCGWGLAGACPGPALVNLASGHIYPGIYIVAMSFGMWIAQLQDAAWDRVKGQKKFAEVHIVADTKDDEGEGVPDEEKQGLNPII